MKKDVRFHGPAMPRPTTDGSPHAQDIPLRVARSPEGLYAVLPSSEEAPEPETLPVFEDRRTAITLARICLALGVDELGPFQE